MTNNQRGNQGEVLVASLLPDSVHLNQDREQYGNVDILWQGIQIDVKTTEIQSQATCAYFTPKPKAKDIVYVLVGIDEDKHYFWVRHSAEKFLHNARLGTQLSTNELSQAIIDCQNLSKESK